MTPEERIIARIARIDPLVASLIVGSVAIVAIAWALIGALVPSPQPIISPALQQPPTAKEVDAAMPIPTNRPYVVPAANLDDTPEKRERHRLERIEMERQVEANRAAEEEREIVGPATLLAAYADNEVAADEKYKGKIVRITSHILNVGVAVGDAYAMLYPGHIQCFVDQKGSVSQLHSGDVVMVIGTCMGKGIFNVQVDHCTFVSPVVK